MTGRPPKMQLATITRGPKVPVTVAEYDVTPGLHDWIEAEAANASESESRWSKLTQQLLALHPYIRHPSKRGPDFYCDNCHVEDGVIEGGGNCPTILALAEAYGLDQADETDVEVIRD